MFCFRALLFFELVFVDILENLQAKKEINMKYVFTKAYEGSVKKYHSWVTQQLFIVSLLFRCEMAIRIKPIACVAMHRLK